jgi:predicted nucleic acid-binding protein
MAWVVDTSVLLDIHSSDPAFAASSAICLAENLGAGLVLCPISYIELAPAFGGNTLLQNQFLAEVGVEWPVPWTLEDTCAAHKLWHSHIAAKRQGHRKKRPVADVLIEAFSGRFEGLITRNPNHFPTIPVLNPQR